MRHTHTHTYKRTNTHTPHAHKHTHTQRARTHTHTHTHSLTHTHTNTQTYDLGRAHAGAAGLCVSWALYELFVDNAPNTSTPTITASLRSKYDRLYNKHRSYPTRVVYAHLWLGIGSTGPSGRGWWVVVGLGRMCGSRLVAESMTTKRKTRLHEWLLPKHVLINGKKHSKKSQKQHSKTSPKHPPNQILTM